jgi:hypothetical protein
VLPQAGLLGPKGYGAMPQPFSISDLVLRPVLNHNDKGTITHHTKAEKTDTGQASLRGATYLVILCPDCRVRPGAPSNIAASCHMSQHTCRV